jgi:phage shock protein A
VTGQDWTEVVGAIGLFTLVITVVTVTIVQVSTTVRAKATLAREAEYRKLAESAIETQQAIERQLAELKEHSGRVQDRLASIERILTQVE